jgi:hypothetical protein
MIDSPTPEHAADAESVLDKRLTSIRRKYYGLQGDMPPFGDVLFLLHLLDARDAEITRLRAERDIAIREAARRAGTP